MTNPEQVKITKDRPDYNTATVSAKAEASGAALMGKKQEIITVQFYFSVSLSFALGGPERPC